MADNTITTLLALTKEKYLEDGYMDELVYAASPFMAMVKKKGGLSIGGKYLVVPLRVSHNNNVSSDLSVSMAGTSSEGAVDFQVPRVKLFNKFSIDGDLLEAIKGGDTGFVDAYNAIVDGSLKQLSYRLCKDLMQSGYGFLGNVKTGSISGATLSLSNPEDLYAIEAGQVCVFSSSLASNTLRNTGGTTTNTVKTVDRNGNVITFVNNISTVTGVTDGDFIFAAGSRDDSSTPAIKAVAGVPVWVPRTAPTGSLFGLTRSTSDSRATGQRYDATGVSAIEEAIVLAAAQANRTEPTAKPDTLYVNPTRYAQLQIALGNRVRYSDVSASDVRWAARGILIGTSYGDINVMSDPSCSVNDGNLLTMDTWELRHTGNRPIRLWDEDGLDIIRDTTGSDVAVTGFFQFRGNLCCFAPSHNMVIKFA